MQIPIQIPSIENLMNYIQNKEGQKQLYMCMKITIGCTNILIKKLKIYRPKFEDRLASKSKTDKLNTLKIINKLKNYIIVLFILINQHILAYAN